MKNSKTSLSLTHPDVGRCLIEQKKRQKWCFKTFHRLDWVSVVLSWVKILKFLKNFSFAILKIIFRSRSLRETAIIVLHCFCSGLVRKYQPKKKEDEDPP